MKQFVALLVISLILVQGKTVSAQSGLCDPITPFYSVNLSGNASGTWVSSPPIQRQGNCCGTTSPDVCIEFQITLAPTAVAISFNIASGAVPPGALFYQVGCGPQTPVGQPICVNGPGPHTLTFCKPGNNQNTYSVTSIEGPSVSPNDTTTQGCTAMMYVQGLIESGITWTSVAPGAEGAYNSYLSCTSACNTAYATPQPGAPPYVDYRVCGFPNAGPCAPPGQFCDIVRVYFYPSITNQISPSPASFCASSTGVMLNGIINGGVPPYQYIWTNGANGTGTVVGNSVNYFATAAGTYSLTVRDAKYPTCPEQITNVVVTVDPVPTVNAGANQTICPTNIAVSLNGSVTNATGGIWSGGTGTFNPGNNALNASYTPSPAEISAGSINLTLTTTGMGSCPAVSDAILISVTAPLQATITAPSIVCFAQNSTLTVNATGGSPPYTYLWNTGATTQSISNQPAGSYSVTVTDATANACTANAAFTIAENPLLSVAATPDAYVSCNTAVTIVAAPSGGNGVYSYLWSNGSTASTVNVTTGSYTVVVTDGIGCTANSTATVTSVTAVLTATVNQPANLCNGTTTPLTVTAAGGYGNYTYSWNNGATTNSIIVGAGSYCATVTDINGCNSTACVALAQDPLLTAVIPTPPTICNGANATVTVSAGGGQPPYSYFWNTGQTTASITQPAGTYSVTVTDANANSCSATASVTIGQEPLLGVVTSGNNVSCNGGNDGSATATVTGGINPIYYLWAPGGQTTATAIALTAGNYSVTVTDNIGCTATSTVIIYEPALLNSVFQSVTNVSCNGLNNGSIASATSGGTPPYSYQWQPGGQTTSTINNLSPGNYSVVIRDANNCSTSLGTTITEPQVLTASVSNATPLTCNGGNDGTATVLASGGTPLYSYLWLPQGGNNATANALTAGNYTVTVSDANGCQQNTTVAITEPTAIQTSTSSVSANCGNADGSASVSASGGVPFYNFFWSNGVNNSSINNLSSGMYYVNAVDANGCVKLDSVFVNDTGNPVNIIPSVTHVSCPGAGDGAISLTISGGAAPYTFAWMNGSSAQNLTNLVGGLYSVIVTSANGCSDTAFITIIEPQPLTLSATISNVSCTGGSNGNIQVIPSGGTPGYAYQWTPSVGTGSIASGLTAGNYSVTANDSRGCNTTLVLTVTEPAFALSSTITGIDLNCNGVADGIATVSPSGGTQPYSYTWSSSPSTTATAIGLQAGLQQVSITDANGCTTLNAITLTEPPPITATLNGGGNTICIGETVLLAVTASGGNGNFVIYWNQGLPPGNTQQVSPSVTTTYIATATDERGCTSAPQSVTVFVNPPLAAVVSAPDTICLGQSATITASGSGGNGNYSYSWNQGLGPGSGPFTVTPVVNTTYTVTLQDDCGTPVATNSMTIVVIMPPVITVSPFPASGCAPLNLNFSATVTPTVPGMTFNWDFGDGTSSNYLSPSHNYHVPGTYIVSLTVTTLYGCSVTNLFSTPVEVYPNAVADFAPDPYTTSIIMPDINFNNYSYNANTWFWSFGDGGTSNIFSPSHSYSEPGEYTVFLIASNAYGCPDTAIHIVSIKPQFTFYIPSAFTPNGNDVNEFFRGYGECISKYEMNIFNRWGDKIYETFDIDIPWDGRANGGNNVAQIGVYVYRIIVTDCFSNVHQYTGRVSLVR